MLNTIFNLIEIDDEHLKVLRLCNNKKIKQSANVILKECRDSRSKLLNYIINNLVIFITLYKI